MAELLYIIIGFIMITLAGALITKAFEPEIKTLAEKIRGKNLG